MVCERAAWAFARLFPCLWRCRCWGRGTGGIGGGGGPVGIAGGGGGGGSGGERTLMPGGGVEGKRRAGLGCDGSDGGGGMTTGEEMETGRDPGGGGAGVAAREAGAGWTGGLGVADWRSILMRPSLEV